MEPFVLADGKKILHGDFQTEIEQSINHLMGKTFFTG